jgi:outer membrane protein TolC
MKNFRKHYQFWLLMLLTVMLSSCASLSKDGGESDVRSQAAEQLGIDKNETELDDESRLTLRDQLLAQPLSMNDAVRVSMLNNPQLQRRFAELRITETELVAAARPKNPGLSLGRLTQGGERETDGLIVFDLIGLLTAPTRNSLAKKQFVSAKMLATQDVLRLAKEVRIAWVDAVAARHKLRYANDVVLAAEAGRDLAETLQAVGNVSVLDMAREQAFHLATVILQKQAQLDADSRLEQLMRLLGLQQRAQVQLPDALPILPNTARTLVDVEQQAINQRIDIQLAKRELDNTAKALKLTKETSFINVLDVGYQQNSFDNAPKETGIEISLEIPLFDWGKTRNAEAEAIYQRAIAHLTETAVQARSEARDAYQQYQVGWEVARYYRDEIIPLQQQMADEMLLRYNGMLISTFELLVQTQEHLNSTSAGLDALRNFWLADAQLISVQQ